MAGVRIGEVDGIHFDSKTYKAVVRLRIDSQYKEIPDDSFASIQTQGLLGGKYIGFSPGGSEMYLKDGSRVEQTQSAIVLEDLINKLFANFADKSGSQGRNSGNGQSSGTGGNDTNTEQGTKK
jgi:phospholipid/cholesterol/gamma-HCH transport system substrate-binding protein